MIRRSPNCRRECGFSLVETLVAMSILSAIVMGSLGMLTMAHKNLADGAKDLEVVARAQSGMEVFRAMPYLSILAPDLTDESGVRLLLENKGDGQFIGRYTVHNVEYIWMVIPDVSELRKSSSTTIRVSAEWLDRQAQRRMLTLGMLRANPVYGGGA